MDGLNKQQLILLALLVSFVTSIATGIVTVSLIDQAPAGLTQTVNRVVEKTIERVVMEPATQSASVVTKETIVLKADDLVIDAIAKNTKSIVRIKEVTNLGEVRKESFAGVGLIVSKDGFIAADIDLAYRKTDEGGAAIPESYVGVFGDGRIFPLNIVHSNPTSGLIFFQPLVQDKEKGVYRFVPPAFGTGEFKLGQAVIAIGGGDTSVVSTGIISNLIEKPTAKSPEAGTSTPRTAEKILTAIGTDLRASELVSGTVLLNLSGEVIGISAGSVSTSRSTFIPAQKVLEVLANIPVPTIP